MFAANQQVVYLDFDTAYDAARGDYNYTLAERGQILAAVRADYAPLGAGSSADYVDAYGWRFTNSEADAKAWTANSGRSYIRLMFSQGRGGGVSGDAGEVDFRNINRRITSEVNVNPLIPTLQVLLNISPTKPLDQLTTVERAALSEAIVKLTTTIASHEVSHTAGLRHADAFGPIGSGLSPDAPIDLIYPAHTGPRNGTETDRHLISSPASVGTTIADALQDLYFGVRESIKLSFNEIGRSRLESSSGLGSHNTLATAQDLGNLERLYVPNNSAPGTMHHGKVLDVAAVAVVGELKDVAGTNSTEVDLYKFTGKAGDIVNVELLVNSIQPVRGSTFDGILRLLNSSGVELAVNDDDFEGTKDATLVDIPLPVDGVYYIEVSRWIDPASTGSGGEYELFISRFKALDAGSTIPAVPGDILRGGPGADRLVGSAADDFFAGYSGSDDTASDNLWGGGGDFDELNFGGQAYQHARDSVEVLTNQPSNMTGGGPTTAAIGQTLLFEWNIPNPPAGGSLQIQWGDGSPIQTISPLSATVTVSKVFRTGSLGTPYQVTANLRNGSSEVVQQLLQNVTVTTFLTVIENSLNTLHAGGSDNGEIIRVVPVGSNQIRVSIGATEQIFEIGTGNLNPIQRLSLYGLSGNDTLIVDSSIPLPAYLDGGAGNDIVRGGGGSDILLGGEGNDQITGFGGNDIMIGGRGRDTLNAMGDQDIVISGYTTHDNNRDALLAISQYWVGHINSVSYASVVQTIRDIGIGTGNWKLNSLTTIDDNFSDVIYGNFAAPADAIRKPSWYLRNVAGTGLRDSLIGGISSEISTDNRDE